MVTVSYLYSMHIVFLLKDKYVRHLVSAMEEVFYEKHGVQQQLVADVHQFMYKTSGNYEKKV